MRIPIGSLNFAHDLGQPCCAFFFGSSPGCKQGMQCQPRGVNPFMPLFHTGPLTQEVPGVPQDPLHPIEDPLDPLHIGRVP
jgi:hypothetical protein